MGKPDQPRGSDGRWIPRNSPTVVVALALGVALATGAGPGAVAGIGESTGGSSLSSGRTLDGKSTSAKGKVHRNIARTKDRLIRKRFRVRERQVNADSDCVAHSYGQVQEFFRLYPCRALLRTQLEIRDGQGNIVLVAVAWVDMPNAAQAQRLKQLMDRDGTGNVTELSRELGGQRFSGDYYRSAREGTSVGNVQAEPTRRTRTALTLAEDVVGTAL